MSASKLHKCRIIISTPLQEPQVIIHEYCSQHIVCKNVRFFSVAVLTGAIVILTATFPGESIKVPRNSTLSQIAAQYGISQSKLEKRNKLENPNYIQEGRDLILYNKGVSGVFQKVSDAVDKYQN